MVEGSKIDSAAHSNDPATHAHEIFAYHDTISLVKQYVSDHPGTVMISVSDHETGGLSLALQTTHKYPEYGWYPEVLTKADRKDYIKKLLENNLGIIDYTQEDIEYLNQNQLQLDYELYLSNMTSHRAELGWATHGHSGVDVNLYAYGDNIDYLYGNHENTDIGEFIINYLGLDLNGITMKLNNGGLLLLTGASYPRLYGTPAFIGYGASKATVHHLILSLSAEGSGMPNNSKVVGILPTTIDTPANRQSMSNADISNFTPLDVIAK
ncbi:7761_t:CDS:10 [Entrophospora sp. SA101]|nr:7761_t:CDS:10 [Entrophospora sp. SA101]